MRIAIPMKSHDPALGGPGTYTVELVRQLIALNRDDEYLLLYPSNPGPRGFLGTYGRVPGVEEVDTGAGSGLFWDLVVVPRACARWSPDVLFSPFMALPITGDFAKVMTVLGAERYMVPGLLRLRGRVKWRIMETIMLPGADAVVSLSNTMTHDFCAALGYPEARVHTVPLGVDREFGRVTDAARIEEVRRRYGLPDGFLLFVGHLFPNKNFGGLVRAMARLRSEIPHPLVVVGGRRWKYGRDLDLVDSLGLRDRVLLLDRVPRADLVTLYSMATCLVFPSWYESFGLAMVEAMACGCPVVAASTGALPEVAGDAALFCDPYDPASIAAEACRFAVSAPLRAEYAARGLARAAGYTWEGCARGTLAVLQGVVERRGGLSRARSPRP
jgi:glycosyltransferase involved in cell wall biosynthesis